MTLENWRKFIDIAARFAIPSLLSLIAGMIDNYHSQAVSDRQELIRAVHASTVTNTRQDQQIKDIGEILQGLKNEIKQPIRQGNN
ncbi:MAG: hypothetical protein HEQ27_19495 [Dolichospermum sp. JUN01]|jgi:hypothetical protein|nr:hypothetical protein [Dolichospermum sp. JUN01]